MMSSIENWEAALFQCIHCVNAISKAGRENTQSHTHTHGTVPCPSVGEKIASYILALTIGLVNNAKTKRCTNPN